MIQSARAAERAEPARPHPAAVVDETPGVEMTNKRPSRRRCAGRAAPGPKPATRKGFGLASLAGGKRPDGKPPRVARLPLPGRSRGRG